MEKTCEAAVAIAPNITEIQQFNLPKIGHDDALLKVESVGICGADIFLYKNITKPMILGHECVGIITKIGKSAQKKWGVKEGDRVVIEEPLPCGYCRECKSLNYQLCKNGGRYGQVPISVKPSLWGGFSEYMYLHPNTQVYKVANHVKSEVAPMFIPISNGIRWVQDIGKLKLGGTIVIQGPGQHGLGCVIAAKQLGAGCIIVTGMNQDSKRFEVAKELGAHHIINVEEEDPIEAVSNITSGEMADVVMDITTGATMAVSLSLELARIGGTIVLAGAKNKPVPDFMSDTIFRKELTIKGVYGRDFRTVIPAIELIESNVLPLELLSTHVFPLEKTDYAMKVFSGEIKTDIPPIHASVTF
ncbi:zinc-binding dehydrogenase [Cytobacillus sp. FSL R5-0569]|uniref:zinc-dependent alcohol dehydrogenase n=1 Tax=Cytobacillus sp. FSL R5-0569 TaxID=2921649 RepID=UPI0030F9AEAE